MSSEPEAFDAPVPPPPADADEDALAVLSPERPPAPGPSQVSTLQTELPVKSIVRGGHVQRQRRGPRRPLVHIR
jgi:hypothetical protein